MLLSFVSSVLNVVNLVFLVSTVTVQSGDSGGDDLAIAKTYSIESTVLSEERSVNVWTPSDYEASSEVYPVLYLLDGDQKGNLMWGVTSMLRQMEQGKAPLMIVVGIDSKDFSRDYMPVATPNRPNSGQADNFRKYIVDELKPWVEANFRTAPYSVLCGSSNAGLFTVYTCLSAPESFMAYIAPSPSIGWCAEYMTALLDSAASTGKLDDIVLYMNYATDDIASIVLNADPGYFEHMGELAPEAMVLSTEVLPDAGHVPFISIHNGLQAIFPDWLKSDEGDAKLDNIIAHYQSLSGKYGWEIVPPAGLLTSVFVREYRAKNNAEAMAVVDEFIRYYPTSPRGYYFQSRLFKSEGKTDQERASLQKALEVDSDFVPAKRALDELNSSG